MICTYNRTYLKFFVRRIHRRGRCHASASTLAHRVGIQPIFHPPKNYMSHTGASLHEIVGTYLSVVSTSQMYNSQLSPVSPATYLAGWTWSILAKF